MEQPTKNYQPHELRVIEEKETLDKKILDLQKFIFDNPIYKTLDIRIQNLQRNQLDAMERYSNILGLRIELF